MELGIDENSSKINQRAHTVPVLFMADANQEAFRQASCRLRHSRLQTGWNRVLRAGYGDSFGAG
jgi:hypothetical protein